jgi:KipI family sensor histidine kinase inhibitor
VTRTRRVRPFGDTALIVDTDSVDEAHRMAAAIGAEAPAGVEDVIVGFRSVTVVADPVLVDLDVLSHTLARTTPAPENRSDADRVDIPVAMDGPDLDEVAALAHLSPAGVVDLLTGADLQVAFVGFSPGFAYLVGLPPQLAAVPRRPTPRPSVPAGSVALAGGFAGVYPQRSPGGWHVLGRTGRPMFDPHVAPYSVLKAGDHVRFRLADIPGEALDNGPNGPRQTLRSDADRCLLVEEGGLLSLLQDRGRVGVAGIGVPRAGAADPYALRIANRLVGNSEDSAAIEITGRGPTLRFHAPAHVAVVGEADVNVDGRRVPSAAVLPIGAGQVMTVGAVRRGLRSYLAIDGGIEGPSLLGSRSSDVLAHLGPGALMAGDVLGLGLPGRARGRPQGLENSGTPGPVRVIVGPDQFPDATTGQFLATTWKVDQASDRVGLRLDGPPLDVAAGIDSRGMVTGAIQVPPDGRPILLLCDHATVGGYPVIATVVSADLGRVGQLQAGDPVHFEAVDRAEARRCRLGREKSVQRAAVGWYPIRTD